MSPRNFDIYVQKHSCAAVPFLQSLDRKNWKFHKNYNQGGKRIQQIILVSGNLFDTGFCKPTYVEAPTHAS